MENRSLPNQGTRINQNRNTRKFSTIISEWDNNIVAKDFFFLICCKRFSKVGEEKKYFSVRFSEEGENKL